VKICAIVLTGMGKDGSQGAKALHEQGAHVIAQDEASSVVWGMPGSTVKLNAAHQVLPLADIADAVIHWRTGR
jgi:two-component system chemotaxis response regulator CheB